MDSTERKSQIADLSAYLDGELSEQRSAEVDRILAESDEARQTLRELRSIASELQALTHIKAPSSLAPAIEREAERKILLASQDVNRKSRLFSLGTRISGAAAVVLACVFGVWMVTHPARDATSEEPLATGVIDQPENEVPGPPALASRTRVGTASSRDADAAQTNSQKAGLRVAGASATPPASGASPEKSDRPAAGVAGAAPEPVVLGETLHEIPSISVLIAPTSPEEYRVAKDLLTTWASELPAQDLRRTAAPVDGATPSIAPAGAPFEIDQAVAGRRAAELIQILQGCLPERVRLTVSARTRDLDRVYTMIASKPQPAKSALSIVPSEHASESGGFADVAETPVATADAIRTPASAAASDERPTPSSFREERAAAQTSTDKGADARKSPADAPPRARSVMRGNQAGRGGRGFSAPRAGGAAPELRRADSPARNERAPASAPATSTAVPADAGDDAVTRWLLDGNAALDDWAGWLLNQATQGLVEISNRVQAAQHATDAKPVRLRVTLLPPPTSQPTSAPRKQP